MTAFVLLFAAVLIALAVMAAIADWAGEPERWDSRRRNR